jgi:signal transduction histidine kinase/CheY-like chemotaxis protein/HPt (histidine-containing phosphotransfer) domain-containing protein
MLDALPNLIARIQARIGAKLLFSLLSLVALFIVLGWIGILALQNSDARTQALIELQRRIAAYQSLQGNTTALQAIVTNAFFKPSPQNLETARRQIGQIAYDFDRAEFVSAEDRDRLEAVREDYTKLVVTGHKVLDRIEAGALEEAREIQTETVFALGDRIERLSFGLIAKAEADMLQKGAEGRRNFLRSRNALVALSVLSVLYALGVGFAISRSLVRPLRRTSDRLSEIEAGDFSGTLVVENRDEIGELAQNVNRMSSELESLYKRLEEASKHKSEFLATMSHEIRTPMNAIMSVSELLLDTPLTREQREYARTSRDSGRALLTVIDDILDFSKIEAGELELEQAGFNLRSCVEGALDMIAHVAAHKDLDLAYRIEDGTPEEVVGDVVRLRQVLINLLNNAVKFTEKGEVVVEITADQEMLDGKRVFRMMVRDTGIGIPEDRLDRLFQSFKQVDTSTTRKYGGTGLGLAISKRLIHLMGGDIGVTSKVGSGTTFRFHVVLSVAANQASSPVGGVALRGRKAIAHCDPTSANCSELGRYLEAWGLQVVKPAQGKGQKEGKQDTSVDAVIVDVDHLDPGTSDLSDLMADVSDAVSIALVRRGITRSDLSKFDSVIRKPFKPSELYNALVDLLLNPDADERDTISKTASVFDGTLARRHPLRIMVADDHPTNRKIALQVLKRLGYDAKAVDNGKAVLAEVSRNSYDLVFMDIHMPEMDGIEATAELRFRYPDGWPRVVILSANVVQSDWESCRTAGAVDIVRKPIEIGRLVEVLKDTHEALDGIEAAPELAAGAETVAAQPQGHHFNRIDPAAIQQLLSLIGGEPRLFRELLDNFRTEARQLFERLEKGVQGDANMLRVAAHTLKSSAADFGAIVLHGQLAELERLGQMADIEAARSLLQETAAEWQQVEPELCALADSMTEPGTNP